MTTLPEMTERIDDEFVTTWYEIRAEAIDNILDATVVSAALRDAGCFHSQVGSDIITRTIRYGKKTIEGFGKGSTLPADEDPLETMAWWPWKYFTVPVTRSLIDDQQNAGPSKIKDYVQLRLTAAREGLVEGIEDILMADDMHFDNDIATGGTSRTSASQKLLPYSLFDYLPDLFNTDWFATGTAWTYGNVGRGVDAGNDWWVHMDFTDAGTTTPHRYDNKPGPVAVTLYEDMVNAYNYAGRNKEYPNLIITSQEIFEFYDQFATSKDQLIKDATTKLADLGYEVFRFKGKPIVWSDDFDTVGESAITKQMMMLNTNYFEIVYDPNLWFDMSDWRVPPRQHERVAYISSSMQCIGTQPRRNARIYWDS